jgi:multicomponent Na+:H+ antiporter subunit E
MWRRILPLWCWSLLVWVLLTWTATLEQIAVGLGVSLAIAFACAPLGPVAGPWALLRPRRIPALLSLAAAVWIRVIAANWRLTRTIWSGRPVPSGMVIVPTAARSDGEIATVAVLTSLIVNSQLVDVDRKRHELQYHLVEVERREGEANRARVNGPIEDRVLEVTRR